MRMYYYVCIVSEKILIFYISINFHLIDNKFDIKAVTQHLINESLFVANFWNLIW